MRGSSSQECTAHFLDRYAKHQGQSNAREPRPGEESAIAIAIVIAASWNVIWKDISIILHEASTNARVRVQCGLCTNCDALSILNSGWRWEQQHTRQTTRLAINVPLGVYFSSSLDSPHSSILLISLSILYYPTFFTLAFLFLFLYPLPPFPPSLDHPFKGTCQGHHPPFSASTLFSELPSPIQSSPACSLTDFESLLNRPPSPQTSTYNLLPPITPWMSPC